MKCCQNGRRGMCMTGGSRTPASSSYRKGQIWTKMFRGISKQARPAAKDWVHSDLLAFAEVADLSLVAFDRAIKQKDGSALLLQ